MSLLFLKIRLATFLGLFICDVLGFYLKKIQSFLLSTAFLLLILCSVIVNIIHNQQVVHPDEIISVALANEIPHQERTLTKKDIEEQISINENQLLKQPEHLQILINTSLLYQALTEQKKAHLLWERAKELDPNNQVFMVN